MQADNIISKYQSLAEKKSSLSLKLASEESAYNTHKESYNNLLKTLKETYGCSSIEEAEALLQKEESSLSTILQEASNLLKTLEGSDSSLDDLSL